MNHKGYICQLADKQIGLYNDMYGHRTAKKHNQLYTTYIAIRALGNERLAAETDRLETLADLRAAARSRPIFDALVKAGACIRGLGEVGVWAVSWDHLGVCIREIDLQDVKDGEYGFPTQPRDCRGYMGWCEKNLDEITYELVLQGFNDHF